ncbi:hypothetical protein Rhe02_14900 [Rhizocola hellebori]|uniref:Carrier domain-containing protein n=1 Tax=Rhizocola hellebori TaxID=1392758 RepID=A0A8J3Q3T7_9ACTN|nr:non-ribosomal peptide synthetase [Rhizocola hellebori]GIH03423.1 hypothetical protein Rhe02_14900 [Rhizocola hellebori]
MADAVGGCDGDEIAEPSAPQRRLWLIHQIEPAHPAYHICLPVALNGLLDLHSLAQGILAVERRHPALRARFYLDGARLRVRYAPPLKRRPHLIDVGSEDLDGMLNDLARRPFDLETGPVARWTLLRAGTSRHILVLAVHHIAFDGASLPILRNELQGLTNAIRRGRPVPPGPTPGDGERPRAWAEADLRYWREQLDRPPPPLSIWSNDAEDTGSAIVQIRPLETRLVDAMRRFGKTNATTMFMLVLAALAATLRRYTGRQDLVIGSPVSTRETEHELTRIGLMLNLIALRLRTEPETTFAGLVRCCRDVVLEAIDHRTVPFEMIVDAVRPERSEHVSPLFQVLFAYQQPPEPPRLPDVDSTLLPSPTLAAKYALSVTVTETADRVELALEAPAGHCGEAELACFADYLTTLLAAGIADPDRTIDRLPLALSPGGGSLPASDSAIADPSWLGLAALLDRAANLWPDAIAVHACDGQLSYAQLNRRAGRLASELVRRGAGPEQVIGVCLPRRLDLIVALLAVAKTGAAFLPLDPRQPEQRRDLIIADAHAMLVIGRDELVERPNSLPPRAVHRQGLAYILYTSGSTGEPKGVGITHGNVSGFLGWAASEFSDRDLSATVAVTSVGFDLSIFEMFAPMVVGGTVVLVDGPEGLAAHPGIQRATLLNTVPSVAEVLLDADCLPAALSAVNLAGEPLPRDLVDRLLGRMPRVQVRNLYGPSEATTYVTSSSLRDGRRQPSIGRAVAGAQVWLVDGEARPEPIGISGRLLLGGPPLARGYVNQAGLTAEAFRPDGLSGRTGARLYDTGDLARLDFDGQLRFLGRADQQIKLRGVRIELEEIEVRLRAHDDVRDAAVVVVRQGERTAPRLVAFVCPAGARPVSTDELVAHLRRWLPEVMVPSGWAVLDDLPRNANGKLDRHLLARTAASVSPVRSSQVPPETVMEKMVAEVWSEVLGHTDIGVHDLFFDIGGNSLQLIYLHHRLRDIAGERLHIVDLFRWPTVATLAAHIERLRSDVQLTDMAAARGAARGAARRARALGEVVDARR